jgi:hypothetical protein
MKPPFAELNPDIGYRVDPPAEGPSAQTALQLMQAIYRDPAQPQHTRIKCAAVAIAYESAKLSVSMAVNHRGMGDMIDRAHAKHLEARRLEPESPVASAPTAPAAPTFRRLVPAMSGDEAQIGAPLRPKRSSPWGLSPLALGLMPAGGAWGGFNPFPGPGLRQCWRHLDFVTNGVCTNVPSTIRPCHHCEGIRIQSHRRHPLANALRQTTRGYPSQRSPSATATAAETWGVATAAARPHCPCRQGSNDETLTGSVCS